MEEITKEIHRISDQIGENIYENMMDGLERHDRVKQRTAAKAEELRQKYEQLLNNPSRFDRRILRAFPTMESRRHKELLEELKRIQESISDRNTVQESRPTAEAEYGNASGCRFLCNCQ